MTLTVHDEILTDLDENKHVTVCCTRSISYTEFKGYELVIEYYLP